MNHRMKSGALIISLLALAACSDSAGLESFEDSLTLDVAMIAADAAIDEFGDVGLLFGGGGTSTRNGTHTATFYDKDGNVLPAHDPATSWIHLVIESSHEFSRDSWSATGTRSRDLVISGLDGEETTRIVNGTGSSSMTRSQHTDEDGTSRTYSMLSTSTIVDVVHPVPRTDDSWPLSGTITRDVTINIVDGPDGDDTKSRTVVIIFNGTNLVTMTVYIEAAVDGESFELDLSTRSGRHPFRKRG